jgi:hypothetical protein
VTHSDGFVTVFGANQANSWSEAKFPISNILAVRRLVL